MNISDTSHSNSLTSHNYSLDELNDLPVAQRRHLIRSELEKNAGPEAHPESPVIPLFAYGGVRDNKPLQNETLRIAEEYVDILMLQEGLKEKGKIPERKGGETFENRISKELIQWNTHCQDTLKDYQDDVIAYATLKKPHLMESKSLKRYPARLNGVANKIMMDSVVGLAIYSYGQITGHQKRDNSGQLITQDIGEHSAAVRYSEGTPDPVDSHEARLLIQKELSYLRSRGK